MGRSSWSTAGRAAAVCAALSACDGRSAPPPTAPAAEPSPVADAPPTEAATSRTSCTLAVGHTAEALEVDGVPREYVRVVGSEVRVAAPVVFAWHGFGSNPEQMLGALQPATFWADAIVVAPRGLGRTFEQFGDAERPGFQVHAGEHADRDLRLFDAIVRDLEATGCLDPTRVYTTGFSNGGFFTNVLACHRGETIAAAAPVGGGGPFVPPCGAPVPVSITHGRADRVVPFDGAEKSWAFWLEHAGCPERPALPADGCLEVEGCAQQTELEACVFAGGHTWPQEQARRIRDFLAGHAKTLPP